MKYKNSEIFEVLAFVVVVLILIVLIVFNKQIVDIQDHVNDINTILLYKTRDKFTNIDIDNHSNKNILNEYFKNEANNLCKDKKTLKK